MNFQWQHLLRGILAMMVLVLLLWLMSSNRRKIDWRLVAVGIISQFIIAILLFKVPGFIQIFSAITDFFVHLLDFSKAGADFLFGGLVGDTNTFGYLFAFQVLPTIVFFGALTALLYHLGILQRVVYVFAWMMSKTMRLSGAESLCTAANAFLGQTEAPLLVRPYLERMSASEIFCLMTGGMATIAGGVLGAYIGFLGGDDPIARKLFAEHLLSASIISVPAAIVCAKMLVPETEEVDKNLLLDKSKNGANVLEAVAIGTSDGLRLAVNVGAMLLVFTAIMAMFNYLCYNLIGSWTGWNDAISQASSGRYEGFTAQYILGLAFSPLAWLIGINGDDVMVVGQLLGEKTILNEFYAYKTLSGFKQSGTITDSHSIVIATYALCGFANFASIGIQIGGIGALAPSKRSQLAKFGVRSLIGGTIACLMTGVVAGILF